MKILGISGRRSSGKDSLTNYITMTVMRSLHLPDGEGTKPLIDWDTKLSKYGKILFYSGNDKWDVFELENPDPQVQEWLHLNVYQFIKSYAFADPIKHIIHDLFRVPLEQLYGTPEQKESLTQYKWGSVVTRLPKGIDKDLLMPAREMVKYIGEYFRRFYENVWVDKTLDWMKEDSPKLAIAKDIRRVNEFEAVKAAGGKIIRLLRAPVEDGHNTETDLDGDKFDVNNFDAVIANQEMTIEETCMTAHQILEEWGYFDLS